MISICHNGYEENKASLKKEEKKKKRVVIVTGGRGLLGKAIQKVTEDDFRSDETYIFLSSKDADLR